MNLPNYFLADLPAEATLSSDMILEACSTLKRNRERYLAPRSTPQMVRLIAELADAWTQDDYPFRQRLLALPPEDTGFSRQTLASGLDAVFKSITIDSLTGLLRQELGHDTRLDDLRSGEEGGAKQSMAVGPSFLVHWTAGNLPASSVTSVLLGLLVRSAQFVKATRANTALLRLLAHSIYDMDAKLGACLEVASWKGGGVGWERTLLGEADTITVMGGDEAIDAVQRLTPRGRRVVAYGPKVSLGYLTRDALSGYKLKRWAESAAADIAAWDQRGCLSPHVLYVQDGGETPPERFAELVAAELAKKELSEPRGPLSAEAAAAITTRRGFYEVRASHSPDTRQWRSEGSTAWTVIFENDPQFQLSCLNRFVYVKPVSDLDQLLNHLDVVREKVSTVGLAALDDEARVLARTLARWGVTRVCRLGRMQQPPITWRHDGRPALGDLVRWCDWENAH